MMTRTDGTRAADRAWMRSHGGDDHAAATARVAGGTGSPGWRVLVVEDNDLLRGAMVEHLRWGNAVVAEAATIRDGLAGMEELLPDVVVLDLRLKDGHGSRFLDACRADPALASVPVVVLSGDPSLVDVAPDPPVRARLLKPFDLSMLESVLRTVLLAGSAGASPLTPRQHEVARLVARGATNKDIARALVIESGTVANHLGEILRRLGCENRAQVAAWVVTRGLPSPSVGQDGHERSDGWVGAQGRARTALA